MPTEILRPEHLIEKSRLVSAPYQYECTNPKEGNAHLNVWICRRKYAREIKDVESFILERISEVDLQDTWLPSQYDLLYLQEESSSSEF